VGRLFCSFYLSLDLTLISFSYLSYLQSGENSIAPIFSNFRRGVKKKIFSAKFPCSEEIQMGGAKIFSKSVAKMSRSPSSKSEDCGICEGSYPD